MYGYSGLQFLNMWRNPECAEWRNDFYERVYSKFRPQNESSLSGNEFISPTKIADINIIWK